MRLDSSLGEAYSILHAFFESHRIDFTPWERSKEPGSSSHLENLKDGQQQNQGAMTTTTSPTLPLLPRIPQFNNNPDCGAISRSATEAIRQATQQASEQIRQASQSASQAIQQATISATNAVRDAQNSASQSVAQASRSSSSISSSASSAISSVQSSADREISSARSQLRSAIAKAEEAVAVATGNNARAGSSILSHIARVTDTSGQPTCTNQIITSSQTVAITPTQAALAIVGSILASTLIAFAVFFFLRKHRKAAAARQRAHQRSASWRSDEFREAKGLSNQVSRTSRDHVRKESRRTISDVSLSMFPKTPTTPHRPRPTQQAQNWKPEESWKATSNQTSSKPAGPFRNWLKIQRPLSPFGSIKLPVSDTSSNAGPLGGQLKSPLFNPHPGVHPIAPPVIQQPIHKRKPSDLPLRIPDPEPDLDPVVNVTTKREDAQPKTRNLTLPSPALYTLMPSPRTPKQYSPPKPRSRSQSQTRSQSRSRSQSQSRSRLPPPPLVLNPPPPPTIITSSTSNNLSTPSTKVPIIIPNLPSPLAQQYATAKANVWAPSTSPSSSSSIYSSSSASPASTRSPFKSRDDSPPIATRGRDRNQSPSFPPLNSPKRKIVLGEDGTRRIVYTSDVFSGTTLNDMNNNASQPSQDNRNRSRSRGRTSSRSRGRSTSRNGTNTRQRQNLMTQQDRPDDMDQSAIQPEPEIKRQQGKIAAQVKRTELEWKNSRGLTSDGEGGSMREIEDPIRTPDTAVSRSVKIRTAVRGRVLVPSVFLGAGGSLGGSGDGSGVGRGGGGAGGYVQASVVDMGRGR